MTTKRTSCATTRPSEAESAPHAEDHRPSPDSDPGRRARRPGGARSRRPKRLHAGLEARWSGGRWRWRARVMRGGRVHTGPLRDDQETAAADRAELLGELGGRRRAAGVTLAEALELAVVEARRRGVSERTIRDDYQSRVRYLCGLLGGDRPLVEATGSGVLVEAVREARRAGRTPSSLSRDLWVLGRAVQAAGLRDPVPALRSRELRGLLAGQAPQTHYLRPDQVAGIIRRMRARAVEPGQPAPPAEECERDADLVELLYVTGIRAGELGRVKVTDVEWEPPRIYVAEPKDRGNPRTQHLPRSSEPVLRRFVARARAAGSPLLVPNSEKVISATCSRWRELLGLERLSGRLLRHSYQTAATACAGATVEEAARLAGHRRVTTTARYLHGVGERHREIVERIGEALGSGGSTP